MGLTAADWVTLRENIQTWLYNNIPEEVASRVKSGDTWKSNPEFERLTGLNQAKLEANWAKGGMLTSCNSFAGKVAQAIGVPGTSVLAKGFLDISQAEKEVPGCWQEANSADACLENITPHAGDFYSSWFKGEYKGKPFFQKWGHVGIVYSYEEDTGNWWLVQGGQRPRGSKVDFIKWKYAKFDRTKINGWVDMARYLMPQGPYAINSPEPDRPAAIYEF
jgi:hypothetical protein